MLLDETADMTLLETENDEEEDDDVVGQADHLVKLMARHNSLISKKWIVIAICIQLLIILLAFALFFQGTLYHFKDNNGELTPLYFWPNSSEHSDYNNFAHTGERFIWFHFESGKNCIDAGIAKDSQTCVILMHVKYSNSFLVGGLGVAFVFTMVNLVLLVLMFWKKYYRFTNLVLVVPVLSFFVTPVVWYYVSYARNNDTEVIWNTIYLIFLFGFLELICYMGGIYYTNKLYKADFNQMLLEGISDDEADDSDEDFDVVKELNKDDDYDNDNDRTSSHTDDDRDSKDSKALTEIQEEQEDDLSRSDS